MGLPYWQTPPSPEKPYSVPPIPRVLPSPNTVRRPYRGTLHQPDPTDINSPGDRITTVQEIEHHIARYRPGGPVEREARDTARADAEMGGAALAARYEERRRANREMRMNSVTAEQHLADMERVAAEARETALVARNEARERRVRDTVGPEQHLANLERLRGAGIIHADVGTDDTGGLEPLSGRSLGEMENLGSHVARTQAQRQAAMEAGRRAYRRSVGIESADPDPDEEEDTPEAAAVRDPLTWRTRDDGSVIPPSMESSQGEQREQPQPFLGGDGAIDFNSRAEELERTRRDLERRYETRLMHLRAAAPRIRAQRGAEASTDLFGPQRARELRQGRIATRQREIERIRREGADRAALLQPGRRSVSNLRRYLRRQSAAGGASPASPMSPAWPPASPSLLTLIPPIGGLGDRERSLSPENDNAWDTLLTTISPDPQPPSASSSFASATTSTAASASSSSFGARSNDSSAATSIDVNINSESGNGPSQFFENICETFEERGDSDDEEVADAGQVRSGIAIEDPTLDVFWRGYTDVVTRRADRVARVASVGRGGSGVRLAPNHPFGGMQRIVQRLATREDIPDEWWATAGLARIVAREEES